MWLGLFIGWSMAQEVKKIWIKPEITQIIDVNLETENAVDAGTDLGVLHS